MPLWQQFWRPLINWSGTEQGVSNPSGVAASRVSNFVIPLVLDGRPTLSVDQLNEQIS